MFIALSFITGYVFATVGM